MRPQCIHDGSIQTQAQVMQSSSKRVEFQLLGQVGGLPEALKGLRNIVLFALQATGGLSAGMATQPAKHQSTETVLHPGPGFLVPMHSRTAYQLDTIGICVRLTPALVVEFYLTQCCNLRNSH